MDQEYHVPVEIEVFRVDIEKSNAEDEFKMERWVDYKNHFNMPNLSPSAHSDLSKSFLSESARALQFKLFSNKKDFEDSEAGACDQSCQKR